MVGKRAGFHNMVTMALCAVVSLLAFVGFLILMAFHASALAYLGLVAALACPAIWLTVLLSDHKGSALAGWVKLVQVQLYRSTRRGGERI